MNVVLPIIFLVFGVVARMLVPWLIARYRNPDNAKWTWRYFWPMLLGAGIALLLLPLLFGDLETIKTLAPGVAYLAGWGVADQAKVLFLDAPQAARRS